MANVLPRPPSSAPAARRAGWPLRRLVTIVLASVLVLVWWFFGRAPATFRPALPEVHPSDFEPVIAAQMARALGEVRRRPRSGRAWGELGMVLQVHDLPAEAAACYTAAARFEPEEPRWPFLHAQLLRSRNHAGALEKLRRAVALTHELRETPLWQLAEALVEAGSTAEAEAAFRKLQALRPEHPGARLGLAGLLRSRGELEAARRLLQGALNDRLTAKRANALLSAIERQAGDVAAAEAAARRAGASAPDLPPSDPWLQELAALTVGRKGWGDRAQELLDQGRHAEAAAILAQLLQTHPEAPEGWLLQGRLRFEQNDCAGAEAPLRRHLELAPGSVNGHAQLGIILLCLQRYPEAIAAEQRAIQLKPDYAEAHFNLGFALARARRAQEAIPAFRDAIRYSPNFVEPHLTLADLLLQSGETAEARVLLERALQLKPGDERAQLLRQRLK